MVKEKTIKINIDAICEKLSKKVEKKYVDRIAIMFDSNKLSYDIFMRDLDYLGENVNEMYKYLVDNFNFKPNIIKKAKSSLPLNHYIYNDLLEDIEPPTEYKIGEISLINLLEALYKDKYVVKEIISIDKLDYYYNDMVTFSVLEFDSYADFV